MTRSYRICPSAVRSRDIYLWTIKSLGLAEVAKACEREAFVKASRLDPVTVSLPTCQALTGR
jgi:hypothetical protein